MQDHAENTKRIAKNTLMLYGRMLFSMVVSLYTSRVVLNTLGVVDYGIYNVVGGVVGMMSFLNASMSGATSRFMTFELGRANQQRQKDTFSTAMIIHIVIAGFVFVIAETLGLWFVENRLVISSDRMHAARIVYQLSILSMVVGVTQVPYTACITSHEKFNIYALFSIIEVFLRLVIVYVLMIGNYDKLILYSILATGVSVLMMIVNRLYCVRKFEEAHFHWTWKKDVLLPMLNFSGWDLYGNLSVVGRTTGVNMILNMFFGPVLNAASGIATQVQNAVMGIASNMVAASRPQIVKQYAAGHLDSMFSVVTLSIKMSFYLLAVFSVPIILEPDFVLGVWLGTVPTYAPTFCVFTLLFNFFSSMSSLLGAVIHATGKMKRISIINGTLYLSVLPVSYLAFRFEAPPFIPYLYNVLAVMVGMLSNAWTIKKYIPSFNLGKFISDVYLRCLFILALDLSVTWMAFRNINGELMRFILSGLFSVCLLSVAVYFILLTQDQQNKVRVFLKNKICKKD